MTAAAYEFLLHALGSALTAGTFFGAGFGIGWVIWRGPVRRLRASQHQG